MEELVREVYKKDYEVKAKSDKEVDKPNERGKKVPICSLRFMIITYTDSACLRR